MELSGFGGSLRHHRAVTPTIPLFQWNLCYLPVAVVTNYHRLSGLKEQELTLSQIWRPEVQSPFHWVKVKVLARSLSLLEAPGANVFLVASSLPWPLAFRNSWLHLSQATFCGHSAFCLPSVVRSPFALLSSHFRTSLQENKDLKSYFKAIQVALILTHCFYFLFVVVHIHSLTIPWFLRERDGLLTIM